MAKAIDYFGINGLRMEFWRGNGHVLKRYQGEQRGIDGECASLVGFDIGDREALRTIAANVKAGTLVVCPVNF